MFELTKVREVLGALLRAPDDDIDTDTDTRTSGHSAVLSFRVNQAGFLIRDSVTLSSCAWALGRTLEPGPNHEQWLEGFDAAQDEILAVAFGIGDGLLPITTASTDGARSALGAIAGVTARVAVQSAVAALTGPVGDLAGSVAAQVFSTVGEQLADRAEDAVTDLLVDEQDETDEDEGGDDADEEPPLLGVKVLDLDDLVALTRWVAETLGIAEVLLPNAIRIESFQVNSRLADESGGGDILNSFHVDDLARIADAAEADDVGAALTEYLRDSASVTAGRTDVRTAPHTVLRSLAPHAMPAGRWPAEPTRPLALSQQFAVNTILNQLRDPQSRGMFAVNGPPGTGKTTLLRDLIAAIVVERAEVLARLDEPAQVFTAEAYVWRTAETGGVSHPRTVRPLIAELCGYEMVVASSNNGAVENITLEVPDLGSIDRETFPDAKYLAELATQLTGAPAWAAIAARLGRLKFRGDFVERFWWGSNNPDSGGLMHLLKSFGDALAAGREIEGALTWEQAVARFDEAKARVRQLAAVRQLVADILERSAGPDAELNRLRGQALDAEEYLKRVRRHSDSITAELERARAVRAGAVQTLGAARIELGRADLVVDQAAGRVEDAETALREHDRGRPGLLKRLLSWGSGAVWESERLPFLLQCECADADLVAAERARAAWVAEVGRCQRAADDAAQAESECAERLAECRREIAAARTAVERADQGIEERRRALEREQRLLAGARRKWPDSVPGPEWEAAVDDRAAMEIRERSAPWMDEEFATARSEVFVAALDLHFAVLTSEPMLVRESLFGVMDIVRGRAPDLIDEAVLAAWQLLFFVVPVISTTFASLGRMLGQLGRESLGWLFIDEAGQAAPHEAVGALWRTQRAVIVGDPRQLEPVIVLPWSGQRRLCGQFGVDAQWTPQGSSVQSTADRLNRFGTWLPDLEGRGQLWVGAPLRVHRRCDRLMFEVSNEIAYDNLMVYGTAAPQGEELLAAHTWLDVPAPDSGNKWNPTDGQYVLATLNLIRDRVKKRMEEELSALTPDDEPPPWARTDRDKADELKRRVARAVFIVSPFRDVVAGLRTLLNPRVPALLGTVHTTQGKEADIVILVPGTAVNQSGSRDWAAQTPNLLNVAITRARRRLVIVGDYSTWSRHRNFSVLARHGTPDGTGMLTVKDSSNWSTQGAHTVDWRRYDG
ncbi:AAA domain-containing protein [Nocardia sp. JMUB6875]|uniref:AAA domain-containing protein n=1 Tax=Nocardia sp. JMUB6875 TaxID=3158170 RepID=UPI0034E87899